MVASLDFKTLAEILRFGWGSPWRVCCYNVCQNLTFFLWLCLRESMDKVSYFLLLIKCLSLFHLPFFPLTTYSLGYAGFCTQVSSIFSRRI